MKKSGLAAVLTAGMTMLSYLLNLCVFPVNTHLTTYAEEYTIGTYGDLTYTKYNDYVKILGCDASATIVEIPSVIDGMSVTSIENYAFSLCSNLVSITIPESVTSIGDGAFQGCSSLTSITIPDGITIIKESVFCGCTGLTSVTIPENIISIEHRAFERCSSLISITIPDSVISIGYGVFEETPWLENKRKENPLVIVNGILIDGKTCSGDVIIPNSVTSIGTHAFSVCTGMTSVIIPDSVISIESSAFYGCKGLTSVTIPKSVVSIGTWAFEYCTGLTSITISESVASIEWGAFFNCTNLTSITILNPECEIGDNEITINATATIYGYENSTAQKYAEKYDYKFESLGEASASESLTGDANLDRKFTIADAVMLQKWLLGASTELTCWQNVDLCKDGKIDVFDLVMLKCLLVQTD